MNFYIWRWFKAKMTKRRKVTEAVWVNLMREAFGSQGFDYLGDDKETQRREPIILSKASRNFRLKVSRVKRTF